MSYVHCLTCSRAYNLATQPACPSCAAAAAPAVAPPAAAPSLASAVEQLARAMASAPAAERAAAAASMARLAAAMDAPRDREPPPRAIQRASRPAPAAPRVLPLLAKVAVSAVRQLASRAPDRLRAVHARIRALAS